MDAEKIARAAIAEYRRLYSWAMFKVDRGQGHVNDLLRGVEDRAVAHALAQADAGKPEPRALSDEVVDAAWAFRRVTDDTYDARTRVHNGLTCTLNGSAQRRLWRALDAHEEARLLRAEARGGEVGDAD